jgi:hypothetical protein
LTRLRRSRIFGPGDGKTAAVGVKPTMRHAFWKRLGLAGLILAGGAVAASAATDICTDLQSRLDSLNRSNGASGDAYRVYDAQVVQQRAALDRATNEARSAGCYGGFFAPKPNVRCPQMMATVNTMSASLAQVTGARDQYRSDPNTLASQRNDLLRQMSLNRCGNYASYVPPPQNGGFFASLFGGGFFNSFGNGYYGYPAGYGATYRTLCVRSCDGYYFPISFSTTSDHFSADQSTCQAMCPGTNVSLYVHHNPGEESDSMVSLAGQPYSASPTAFKYRTSFDSSCTCGAPSVSAQEQLASQTVAISPDGRTVMAVNYPTANATFTPLVQGPPVMVPTPSLRPAALEDPETLAGRWGGLVPVAPPDQATTSFAGVTADGRPIRIVGPTYFVAQ